MSKNDKIQLLEKNIARLGEEHLPLQLFIYLRAMNLRLAFICVVMALLACVPALADDAVLQKGKTGIPDIDSLPVNEWDIPTEHNSLFLTMLFSVLPGGGQYYTGHYVRGGFITGIEGLLVYEVFFNKSLQRDRIYEQVEPFQDSVAYFSKKLVSATTRDSIKYYQALVDQYNSEGRIRLCLGWGGIFAGLAVMAVGNAISSSGEPRTGKPSEMWADFALCGGLGISIAGFVVRSMGARRLEKAEEYTRTRDMYKRYGSRISVSVAPVVNPISKALGGNLALSF